MSQDAVALLKQFVAALGRNDREGSNEAAFALLAMEAELGKKWHQVAKVLQTNGELTSANKAMRLAVAQTGRSPAMRFEQSAMLAQTGRIADAVDVMRKLPEEFPTPAGHAFIMGTMSVNLNKLEQAEHFLRKALQADPASGQAMLVLANSRKRKQGDPIGDEIVAGVNRVAGAPLIEQAQFHYAAGRVHFDRRETDRAFRHLARGAMLASLERKYDAGRDAEVAQATIDNWPLDAIAKARQGIGVDTSEALFVTGAPRSGTTLVEQILASHSAVRGGEELGRLPLVARDLANNSAQALQDYSARKSPDTLSELFLHLGRERFPGDGKFVDKALNTSRYIGLLASILPQAKVVWLRRNPMDCAWSIFRTYFVKGQDFSWKQEDIAAYLRIEDRLFEHWSKALPDTILPVEYEALVADPRPQIERILDFCGLPHEDAVFAPHENRRLVTTASVMQVREPIGTQAVGLSDPYSDYLEPFRESYFAD